MHKKFLLNWQPCNQIFLQEKYLNCRNPIQSTFSGNQNISTTIQELKQIDPEENPELQHIYNEIACYMYQRKKH